MLVCQQQPFVHVLYVAYYRQLRARSHVGHSLRAKVARAPIDARQGHGHIVGIPLGIGIGIGIEVDIDIDLQILIEGRTLLVMVTYIVLVIATDELAHLRIGPANLPI